MTTPSEVYYTLGDALGLLLNIEFGIASPKKGRQKALVENLVLTMPIIVPGENIRYGSGGRLDFNVLISAPNAHDLLLAVDIIVEWIRTNPDSLGFNILLTGATPYYEGDILLPDVIGYIFEVTVNL